MTRIAWCCYWIKREGISLVHDWVIRRAGLRAKHMFHEQLNNPDTSEGHRQEIRKGLEELEMMVGKRELKRIEAMILEIAKHDGTKG